MPFVVFEFHLKLNPSDDAYLIGELLSANINRSPSAYLNNPLDERTRYPYDTDKEMTLLKFINDEGDALGSFNWFATHGTSMSRTNQLISGDNKGAAARLMEDWYNKKFENQSSKDGSSFRSIKKGIVFEGLIHSSFHIVSIRYIKVES